MSAIASLRGRTMRQRLSFEPGVASVAPMALACLEVAMGLPQRPLARDFICHTLEDSNLQEPLRPRTWPSSVDSGGSDSAI